MKQRVVLSAVNFIEGGPLAIFNDALLALTQNFPQYEVHAFVHRDDLIHVPGVITHAYPQVKASWLRRLRFEYMDCMAISRKLQPVLWLSMHDITPRVEAHTQAVYCHNPAPFDRVSLSGALHSYRHTLFTLLYRYLYRLFIHRNRYVIVQQAWMREAFTKTYGIRNIIVAHPSAAHLDIPATRAWEAPRGTFRFLYPALPRTFKNIETILEATAILEASARPDFEVLLTIDGSENSYARSLRRRFAHLQTVRWLGIRPREEVFRLYADVDALVFPSRLETWGMPITEFQSTGKPILAADLPYAHETAGTYGPIHFFSHTDATALATAMRSLQHGTLAYEGNLAPPIAQPFATDWPSLFTVLLADSAATSARDIS